MEYFEELLRNNDMANMIPMLRSMERYYAWEIGAIVGFWIDVKRRNKSGIL